MNNSRLNAKASQNETLREGPVARALEKQAARLPSDTFLWLALGSIGTSFALQVIGKRETSNFVGQWAPTFLILGLYNKLVKMAGSERQEWSRDSDAKIKRDFEISA